jgi:hypothetical protein
VILHPRRTVLEMEAAALDREVAQIFRGIQSALQAALEKRAASA